MPATYSTAIASRPNLRPPLKRTLISCSAICLLPCGFAGRRRSADLPFAETWNKYGRMQLTISSSRDAADGRLWFNRRTGQWGGAWSSPAAGPAFREGVNVLITRPQEIQKVHAGIFTSLANAEQNEIILSAFLGR